MRFRSTLSATMTPLLVATCAFADDRSAKAEVTPPDRVIQAPAGEVGRIAFSPAGKYLASASGVWKDGVRQVDVMLQLFDVDTGKEIRRFEAHTDRIISLAFSPNGKRLVSASKDKSVRVWDVGSGRQETGFTCSARYMGGAAFVDDTSIAVCQETMVYFLDVTSGEQNRRPVAHPTGIGALACSPKGTYLITGCGSMTYNKPPRPDIPFECRIHVWDIATGSEVQQFAVGSSPVRCVAFSTDGKWALSGSGFGGVRGGAGPFCEDCFLRLWDIGQAAPVRTFTGHTGGIVSVAFTPNGKCAISGSSDHTVRLWELSTGKELARFNTEGVEKGVFSSRCMVRQVACSPDGKFVVACGDDRTIRFWLMPNLK